MKRLALAVLTLAMMVSTNVYGQGKYGRDSAECIKYLSYYTEYYKQKNYDEALPSWRKAYKLCPPTASENMFVQGSTLLRRLIQQNANNAAYRDALVDSLMTLHDTRMQAYPRRAVSVLNTKGLDIHNYIKGNPEAVYKMYEEIIGANKGETDSNLFLFELDAATELVQAGKLDPEQFINIYQRNLEYIKPEDGKKEELEALFITSKVASCENLLELFTPPLQRQPERCDPHLQHREDALHHRRLPEQRPLPQGRDRNARQRAERDLRILPLQAELFPRQQCRSRPLYGGGDQLRRFRREDRRPVQL